MPGLFPLHGSPQRRWRPAVCGVVALAAALAAGSLIPAAPAAASLVIVIRHGDKTPDRTNFNLSPAGFRRSLALSRLIPACFARPTGILAYPMNPNTGKNARSYQTAVPLAMATGVNIRIAEGAEQDSFAIGQQLRQQATSGTGLQVLFWEHRRIPELARGLGWPDMLPIEADDFDQLILFRYSAPGAVPAVEVHRQSVQFLRPCFLQARQVW